MNQLFGLQHRRSENERLHRHTHTFRYEIVKTSFSLHSLLENLEVSKIMFKFAGVKISIWKKTT